MSRGKRCQVKRLQMLIFPQTNPFFKHVFSEQEMEVDQKKVLAEKI